MKFIRSILLILMLFLSIPTFASPAKHTFETGYDFGFGLGHEIESPYDLLLVLGKDGKIGDNKFKTVGDLEFVAGPNCYLCDKVWHYDTPFTFTLDGVTHDVDLNYTWSSNKVTDTLTFAPIKSQVYVIDGKSWTVDFTLDKYTLASSGGIVKTKLNAEIIPVSAVPEPNTYAMMLTGVCLMGFVGRRKNSGKIR